MTSLEDEVRDTFAEIAARSTPVPLIGPVLRRHDMLRRRRRITAAVAAAAAVVAVGSGAAALRQPDRSGLAPAQQPPAVVRTPTATSAQPGPARLMVTTVASGHLSAPPALVVPVAGDAALRVVSPRQVDGVGLQHLSRDGRYLLQLGGFGAAGAPGIVVLDLRTGQRRLLPNLTGEYAELSPDDATVAVRDNQMLRVVDVATGRARDVRRLSNRRALGNVAGAQVGWSPDGRLIAVKGVTDTIVVDLRGRVKARFRGASPVNGSQSWSPDGRSILLYDPARSAYLVAPVDVADDGDLVDRAGKVVTPPDAVHALGWTGDRIVWLVGRPGAQRLVTTDQQGRDRRLWTRLEVGGRTVESVTWSRVLTG